MVGIRYLSSITKGNGLNDITKILMVALFERNGKFLVGGVVGK